MGYLDIEEQIINFSNLRCFMEPLSYDFLLKVALKLQLKIMHRIIHFLDSVSFSSFTVASS